MQCWHCHNEVHPGARFCDRCGADVAEGLSPVPVANADTRSLEDSGTVFVSGKAATLDAGTKIAGRFEIVETIGQGRMGAVYEVRDTLLEDVCALKVLVPDLAGDPAALSAFLQEARISLQLSHPNIIRVRDLFEHDGQVFLSMERLRGMSLREWIRQKRELDAPLPLPEILSIIDQVLAALEHAHEFTVHRDIKPENIFVTSGRHGDHRLIKLLDFGIAHAVTAGFSPDIARAIGTPAYMPPEQLQRQSTPDPRDDLYAVGVVLYELLTGTLPQGAFPQPSAVRTDLDVSFDRYVLSLLHHDRDQRPSSAAVAREDLQALACPEPRQSGPSPSGPTLPEPEEPLPTDLPPRSGRPGVVTTLLVVVAVAVAGGLSWLWLGEGQETDRQPVDTPPVNVSESTTEGATPPASSRPVVEPTSKSAGESGAESRAESSPPPATAEAPPKREVQRDVLTQPAAAIPATTSPKPQPSRTEVMEEPAPEPRVDIPVRAPGKQRVLHVAGLDVTFHWVPAGTSTLGTPRNHPCASARDREWTVKLTHGFWMQETEVTRELYLAVMGDSQSPASWSQRPCATCAAGDVSWQDARLFIQHLNLQLPNVTARLPTEAEWEFAARAKESPQCPVTTSSQCDEYDCFKGIAWYAANAPDGPQPVRQLAANPWGLYDMAGNVREWCVDTFGPLPAGKVVDFVRRPAKGSGSRRVVKGGAWTDAPKALRPGARSGEGSLRRKPTIGFRLVIADR